MSILPALSKELELEINPVVLMLPLLLSRLIPASELILPVLISWFAISEIEAPEPLLPVIVVPLDLMEPAPNGA